MNINQLRYFIAIVETGRFREAAEKLCISQPALSNSIRTLEDFLQVDLLDRRRHGVTPTPYGTVLYDFFKSAVESVERGIREVDLMKDGSRGHVNVGAPAGMIDLFAPQIIEDLISQRPGTTFKVSYGYLDELLRQLRHGELDFLLSIYWPETELHDDLNISKLADISLSIYARAEHPLASKEVVTKEELMDADWIFPQSEGMQSLRKNLFGAKEMWDVKCAITSDHPPFMINILQRLDLLTILPDYMARSIAPEQALKKIQFPEFDPELYAGIMRLNDRHMTPSMRLFSKTARGYIETIDKG